MAVLSGRCWGVASGAPRPQNRCSKPSSAVQINLVITKDYRVGQKLFAIGTSSSATAFVIVARRYRHAENNDKKPFKNILNEMYSSDISRRYIPLTFESSKASLPAVSPLSGIRKTRRTKTICWWTRKPPPLSGKSSAGRWKDTARTLSGAGWKNRRCLALHGGTGNGASAMSALNGKRKTR